MSTTYYALVALDRETPDDPGGIVRRREENGGLWYEILLGDGTWDHRPALCKITWDPDPGDAAVLDTATAEALIERWPPSNLRSGLKR
jgi:hypothetical protein